MCTLLSGVKKFYVSVEGNLQIFLAKTNAVFKT